MNITKKEWDKMSEDHSKYMVEYGPDRHCDGSDLILAYTLRCLGVIIPKKWIEEFYRDEYEGGI